MAQFLFDFKNNIAFLFKYLVHSIKRFSNNQIFHLINFNLMLYISILFNIQIIHKKYYF